MEEQLNGGAPAPAESTPAPEPVNEAPQQDTGSSLADELSAVWDEVHERETGPDRAPDGKFAKRNHVADALAPKAEEPAETEIEGSSPEVETSETAEPSIAPPASLPSEMKAKWNTLPPDVQQVWAKRESESHAKITQLGQAAKAFEPLSKVLEQHKDLFDSKGLTPDDGINRLLTVQRALEQDPHATIQRLAQMYGVTLPTGEPGSDNPQVSFLQNRIAQLESQIRETRERVVSREQREVETQRQAVVSVIDEFAKSKPDYDILEPYIEKEVRLIRQENPELSPREVLEKAYETAVWRHPDTRAKRIADEAAKRAEEDRKAAEKASKVAKLNVKTSASAKQANRGLDSPDYWSALYDSAAQKAG
jgi:hypothetical protein